MIAGTPHNRIKSLTPASENRRQRAGAGLIAATSQIKPTGRACQPELDLPVQTECLI